MNTGSNEVAQRRRTISINPLAEVIHYESRTPNDSSDNLDQPLSDRSMSPTWIDEVNEADLFGESPSDYYDEEEEAIIDIYNENGRGSTTSIIDISHIGNLCLSPPCKRLYSEEPWPCIASTMGEQTGAVEVESHQTFPAGDSNRDSVHLVNFTARSSLLHGHGSTDSAPLVRPQPVVSTSQVIGDAQTQHNDDDIIIEDAQYNKQWDNGSPHTSSRTSVEEEDAVVSCSCSNGEEEDEKRTRRASVSPTPSFRDSVKKQVSKSHVPILSPRGLQTRQNMPRSPKPKKAPSRRGSDDPASSEVGWEDNV